MTTGFVLGKFLPLHKGHQYLIETALAGVDKLCVVVDNIDEEVIPVKTRIDWIQRTYPSAHVTTLRKVLPQYPHEAEDFWQQWENGLKEVLPADIDYVFASETYGERLAQFFDAKFVMVDLDRKNIPICATKIRENPYENWQYLSKEARAFYCKKVCVFGPESTGKSTLTEQLARHYNTNFVPEYARGVIEDCNAKLKDKDIEKIARGHDDDVKKATLDANRVLFVDTDAITTKVWSLELFGTYPKVIDEIIAKTDYDLYLLLDVDVPYVDDIVRYFPAKRKVFLQKLENELKRYGKPYKLISGSWENRFNMAVSLVDGMVEQRLAKVA